MSKQCTNELRICTLLISCLKISRFSLLAPWSKDWISGAVWNHNKLLKDRTFQRYLRLKGVIHYPFEDFTTLGHYKIKKYFKKFVYSDKNPKIIYKSLKFQFHVQDYILNFKVITEFCIMIYCLKNNESLTGDIPECVGIFFEKLILKWHLISWCGNLFYGTNLAKGEK